VKPSADRLPGAERTQRAAAGPHAYWFAFLAAAMKGTGTGPQRVDAVEKVPNCFAANLPPKDETSDDSSSISTDAKTLLDHMRPKIASWWVPDAVEFLDKFPMTGTGKVQKIALRERFRGISVSLRQGAGGDAPTVGATCTVTAKEVPISYKKMELKEQNCIVTTD
jgi:acyl-CoA synthetase (AMP-forming)/AMP-acid ligase II